MNIGLVGYGKMGKAIEAIAKERNHNIIFAIDSKNEQIAFTKDNLQKVDVVIEFTNPEIALKNVVKCLESGVPTVCGSTGWNQDFETAYNVCNEHNTSLIISSNFSLGVNIFFEVNKQLAKIMNDYTTYEVAVEETHHTQKKDAPSGTAITITDQIIDNLDRKSSWQLNNITDSKEIVIKAFREDNIPGTHIVKYDSPIDSIEIKHTAHSRDGFALGAVIAAEYLVDKKGIFTMQDVLFSKNNNI